MTQDVFNRLTATRHESTAFICCLKNTDTALSRCDLIANDTEDGEIVGDTSSDDSIITTHQRKRPRIESKSSISSSSLEAEETPTLTNIPSTKVFSKATNNFFETPGYRCVPPTDASPVT
jgi:hypothetical protein